MEISIFALQATSVILCIYVVIYATGFMLNRLPDIIDSAIYFYQYLKSLKDDDDL